MDKSIGTDAKRFIVDLDKLPNGYPTHSHSAEFWEALGRTIATFGFLEEVLCKAIFAFTSTRSYSDEDLDDAYTDWIAKLERSISDTLSPLICTYGKAVREHPEATLSNLTDLLDNLHAASRIRNVLCHGSWRTPDAQGASTPFYVNKQKERFATAIDRAWLDAMRDHVAKLACAVINSVTHMGYQFPGSSSPGTSTWK